jgi:hypothetical protein
MQKHKSINMRTTLDIADDLGTEIKILAVQENRTLKELISELLRAGLRARLQVQARTTALPVPYRPRESLDSETLLGILRGRRRE